MAVTILKVHSKFQVIEGMTRCLALLGGHQVGVTTTALGSNHIATQAFTHGNCTAELFQLIIGIHVRHHQAHGLIAVDQIVKDHLGPTGHGHPAPTGWVKKGVSTIRALEGIETAAAAAAGSQHQHTHQRQHLTQRRAEERTHQP